jgi:4-hydroxy-tetrahydrodipicolinate reductase
MSNKKIVVFGAAGRMAGAVVRLVAEAPDMTLVGAVDHADCGAIGKDAGLVAGAANLGVAISPDLGSALLGADVLVDFSIAAAFDGMLRAAMHAKVAVVSGTTRLTDESLALIARAAAAIPVLWAPNMSVGVQVLGRLVEQAVAQLGAEYDIEVVEAHHNRKVDAPSGTATFLVEAAQRARPDLNPVFGREGQPGARGDNEIGVFALRGGGVIGDHSVHLVGEADRIEITHRAITRDLFARGAVRAARFVAGRSAGRYDLADVVATAAAS